MNDRLKNILKEILYAIIIIIIGTILLFLFIGYLAYKYKQIV
jgi:hypothetical protein